MSIPLPTHLISVLRAPGSGAVGPKDPWDGPGPDQDAETTVYEHVNATIGSPSGSSTSDGSPRTEISCSFSSDLIPLAKPSDTVLDEASGHRWSIGWLHDQAPTGELADLAHTRGALHRVIGEASPAS